MINWDEMPTHLRGTSMFTTKCKTVISGALKITSNKNQVTCEECKK